MSKPTEERPVKAEWQQVKTTNGIRYVLPMADLTIMAYEEKIRDVTFYVVTVDDAKLGVVNSLGEAFDKAISGAVRKLRRLVDWVESQIEFTTNGVLNNNEKIIPTKTDDVIAVLKKAAKKQPVENWSKPPASGITITEEAKNLFVVRRAGSGSKPKLGRPPGSKNKPKK